MKAIDPKEMDVLDAHLEAAGKALALLKKQAAALRQSLAPVSTRATPPKGKAHAEMVAMMRANGERNRAMVSKRQQKIYNPK